MVKKKLPISILGLILTTISLNAQTYNLPEGVNVRKIWSNEKYNAFTSLISFNGTFYCAFREGESHVYGKDGVTRIISSKDGIKWKSVAVLEKEDYDLRDPKLSVTPDGRIMVVIGGSVYNNKELLTRLTHVSFSNRSGKKFSDPIPVIIDSAIKTNDDWLWRVTWHDKIGYGVVYQLEDIWSLCLLKTTDGIHYELVTKLEINEKPNESTLRIMADGEMLMMVRREGGNFEGMWGRSKPPYKEWSWKSLGMRLGGPDFIALEDNLLISGTRIYEDEGRYTALFAGERSGDFRKILQLPSGGDNSYPGFLKRDNKLYVSYYSSHEGNTSVYLAEILLSYINEITKTP